MEKKEIRLFKLPVSLTKRQMGATSNGLLIGVLDSSGSMSSVWKHVAKLWNLISRDFKDVKTIAFSNSEYYIKGEVSERIQDYGAGGTEIFSGFSALTDTLKGSAHEDVNIIFVSDGGDNNQGTLTKRLETLKPALSGIRSKRIKFLCVGVGTGFPTFVAMYLREMFNTVGVDAPPVFLVEQTSFESFEEQFNLLKNFLTYREQIKVHPPVMINPWEKRTSSCLEESWVLTEEDELSVENVNHKIDDSLLNEINLVEIAKNWMSALQLMSIKGAVKEEATETLRLIEELIARIDSRNAKTKEKCKTFGERILRKNKNITRTALQGIMKEIRLMIEGDILSKLSPQEAAQRLAIGTKVGKFHDKALKMRGITVDDYLKEREEFIKLLKKTTINPESDQEPSVISLQNQKDVFLEADLVQGLNNCDSQYDLVEELPVVGVALKVFRSNGSMINPYLITVKSLAKHHTTLDTVSISEGNDNVLELSLGSDEKEVINCVLPLFGEKDLDIKPLICSGLFRILMTFNVMRNADTMFETAYPALLANVIVYLLEQPDSNWKKDIIFKVLRTFNLFLQSNSMKTYTDVLLKTPRLAMVTDHPDNPTKCEDLSKAILVLYANMESKNIVDQAKIEEILDAIIAEYFGRNFLNEEEKFTDFFSYNTEECGLEKVVQSKLNEIRQIVETTFSSLEKYYTAFELKADLNKLFEEEFKKFNLEDTFPKDFVKLNEEKIISRAGKVNCLFLEKIYFELLGKKIDRQKTYFILLNHAKIRNSYERNKAEIELDSEKITFVLLKDIANKLVSDVKKTMYESLERELEDRFIAYMTKTHIYTKPISAAELKSYPDFEKYKQVECESKLMRNACLAPNCPFYMKINTSLSTHLQSARVVIPALHKTVSMNLQKSPEELYDMVLKGECYRGEIIFKKENLEYFLANKALYLDMINRIIKDYNEIKKAD